jgi:hypothetical protein
LFGERVAQILIVVDDKEAAGIRHLKPFNTMERASAAAELPSAVNSLPISSIHAIFPENRRPLFQIML